MRVACCCKRGITVVAVVIVLLGGGAWQNASAQLQGARAVGGDWDNRCIQQHSCMPVACQHAMFMVVLSCVYDFNFVVL